MVSRLFKSVDPNAVSFVNIESPYLQSMGPLIGCYSVSTKLIQPKISIHTLSNGLYELEYYVLFKSVDLFGR